MDATNETIIGASPPPPGVTPNFEDPESKAYRLIIVAVVFPVLCLPFLGARFWSAAFVLKRWHYDDLWIILAFVSAVINSIICSIQTEYGLGRHMWDVPATQVTMFFKLGVIGGHMTYNLSIAFTKISILLFYLRFSIDQSFKIAVYCVLFVAVGYSIPNALLWTYICRPMQAYWDFSLQPEATCINMKAAFLTNNALNFATDILILLLPIWMLKPLRLPLMKKIGIMLILMTGGFVCAISGMRMITALLGINDTDTTWHYVENLIWCMVEACVGIICACLPGLHAFAKHYFPDLFVFDNDLGQRFSSLRVTQAAHLTQPGSDSNAIPAQDASTALTSDSGNPTLRIKPSQGSEFTIGVSDASSQDTLHNVSEK